MGITGSWEIHQPTQSELSEAEEKFQETMSQTEVSSEDPISTFLSRTSQAVSNALNSAMNFLKKYILAIPYMIIHIFTPPSASASDRAMIQFFAYIIGTIAWIIQLVGIIQFATGREFGGME